MQLINPINKEFTAAIYCRISYDDKTLDESSSISYQKRILEEYLFKNNIKLYDTYIDDGYSGTNFDRPGFQKMLKDIESHKINLVITKDLSRLGRDYKLTGYYIDQYFPEHNIRYIALNDNVDSFEEEKDMAAFINVINEMYAKDISKKIRQVADRNMEKGKDFTSSKSPLYGFMYDDKGLRIINEEVVPTIKMIFEMYKKEILPSDIAKELKKRQILTPKAYNNIKFNFNEKRIEGKEYDWKSQYITGMIKNPSYIGTLVRHKTSYSRKTKTTKLIKEENQFYFENRFEPIIDIDTFNICQAIANKRKEEKANKYVSNTLSLCRCGICGSKLANLSDKKLNGRIYRKFICLNCKKDTKQGLKKANIEPSKLDEILIKKLKELRKICISNRDKFLEIVTDYIKSNTKIKTNPKITLLETKLKEIDKYITKSFEKNVIGEMPDEIYLSIVKKYNEQKEEINNQIIEIKTKENKNDIYGSLYKDSIVFLNILENLDDKNMLSKELLNKLLSEITITTNGKKDKKPHVSLKLKQFDFVIKELKRI